MFRLGAGLRKWGALAALAFVLVVPQAAWGHDVSGQEDVGGPTNGITARASGGLSTPVNLHIYTSWSPVYVWFTSDSKHYVKLNHTANTNIANVSWYMKVSSGSTTLDYIDSGGEHIVTTNGMGIWELVSNLDYSPAPFYIGYYSGSADAWVSVAATVGAQAPTHTHTFTVQPP